MNKRLAIMSGCVVIFMFAFILGSDTVDYIIRNIQALLQLSALRKQGTDTSFLAYITREALVRAIVALCVYIGAMILAASSIMRQMRPR